MSERFHFGIEMMMVGFIIGFIVAGLFTVIENIDRSSNTELLCGVLADNNVSNSTVISICKK